MATIPGVYQEAGKGSVKVTWTAITENDTGGVQQVHRYPDKTIQATGTFGGATVTLQGSNDGTNFTDMVDPQGNTIAFASAGIEQVLENPEYVRIAVSGGAATSINVSMLCRSSA